MDPGRHERDETPDGGGHDPMPVEEQPASDEVPVRGHGAHRQRKHRRVRTQAVAGSDPTPQPEPPRHSSNENDDRLKADKPPHWG